MPLKRSLQARSREALEAGQWQHAPLYAAFRNDAQTAQLHHNRHGHRAGCQNATAPQSLKVLT
eukprot:13074386-Alexandrium_andersonii.AAC.1